MSKHGAACDNLLSARLVTADGTQVEATPEPEYPTHLSTPSVRHNPGSLQRQLGSRVGRECLQGSMTDG
jgi:hypothetical protein